MAAYMRNRYKISFKLCTVMSASHHHHSQANVTLTARQSTRIALCSSNTTSYSVSRLYELNAVNTPSHIPDFQREILLCIADLLRK